MKTVLDTNIFISAVLWKGAPHKILELAEQGTIIIASSQEILEELHGVIQRPKFKPYLEQADVTPQLVMERIFSLVQLFSPTKQISAIEADPSDNKFLSCALASRASFIVSGDRHLIHLKQFSSIPIVTPHQFLTRLKSIKHK